MSPPDWLWPAPSAADHTADMPFASAESVQPELTQDYRSQKAALQPPSDWPALPGYEILSVLGRGGMGVVYKARQKGLNRLVALKMILAGGHAGAELIGRFRAEAEAVARLRHPNIVQIHEIGEVDGHPFICLEYLEGGTLADLLGNTPQPAERAAEVVRLLAGAVEAAHQCSIVHRDLKPANILVAGVGSWESGIGDTASGGSRLTIPHSRLPVLKITDFGLAKQLDTDSAHTQSGSILGTPSYMAPEQAAGRAHDVGAAADIYALGAILYEMLVGRPPFRGASVLDTLEQVRHQEPVPPRQLLPRVPRDLETICLKCLHKDPARRYASAAALSDDLGRFLTGEPILARPVSAPARLWRWCKRNPRVAWLSGAVAFLFVAGLAISLYLNFELNREKAVALANERIAIDQADLALDAIGEMIFEVRTELQDTPGGREAQLSILRKATADLHRLVNMPATSDKYLRRHAIAHLQLSRVAWGTGDLAKTHEELKIAEDFARKGVAANPQSDKAHYNLAAITLDLGRVAEVHLRKRELAAEYYEAVQAELLPLQARLTEVPEGEPSIPEAERVSLRTVEELLCNAYDYRGHMYYAIDDTRKHDYASAMKLVQKALEIRQRQHAAKPDAATRHGLALSYIYRAEIAQIQGDCAGAAAGYSKAVEQHEAIYQERRSSINARRSLAQAHHNCGDSLCYAGQPEKALEHYRAALPLNTQIMQSEPDNRHARAKYAHSNYCVGVMTVMTDRKQAMKYFNEALKIREENYREAVATKSVIDREELNTLMLTLAWCGQHERATALAAKLKPGISAQFLAEDIGPTYGICMASIGADKTPDELTSAERELQAHYREEALAAFREAIARGYSALHYLERDPDLQPMRGIPEYEKLLDELRKAKK